MRCGDLLKSFVNVCYFTSHLYEGMFSSSSTEEEEDVRPTCFLDAQERGTLWTMIGC